MAEGRTVVQWGIVAVFIGEFALGLCVSGGCGLVHELGHQDGKSVARTLVHKRALLAEALRAVFVRHGDNKDGSSR